MRESTNSGRGRPCCTRRHGIRARAPTHPAFSFRGDGAGAQTPPEVPARAHRVSWPRAPAFLLAPGSSPWRRPLLVLLALAVLVAIADFVVGQAQQRWLERRDALREKLDWLAWHGLRTGVDDIRYEPSGGYTIEMRLQNASDSTMFVMLPTVRVAVQQGGRWVEVPVGEPADDLHAAVVELKEDQVIVRIAALHEQEDYTELMPGYMHVRLSLETYVSPVRDPQYDIGERIEDIFMHVQARHNGQYDPGRPAYIPLRAWTLLPPSASP